MPDPAGTRYATLTSTDQSANVWVISIISLCVSTACFAIRGLSKSRTGLRYGPDDYTLIGGWSLSVIQVALIIKSLTLGLGKDVSIVPVEHVEPMERYLFASLVFGILSLYTIKISMVLLIQRLFTKSMLPFWIAFAVLGVASLVSLAAGCPNGFCSNSLARWIVAIVFDILTEVVIITLPMYCIRNIQMAKTPKIKVQASFFSRLIVVLFASLTIRAIGRLHNTSQPSTAFVLPVIFGQLEVCISLCIASIIPCFRIIFQSSEKVPTSFSTNGYHNEPKPEPESSQQDSFWLGSVNNHTASGALPRTKTPDHSPTSSQDMGVAHSSHSTGRISPSSIAPSGATGLSQKALVV